MPRKIERISTHTLSKKCGKSPTWWRAKKKDKNFWGKIVELKEKMWERFYEDIRNLLKK